MAHRSSHARINASLALLAAGVAFCAAIGCSSSAPVVSDSPVRAVTLAPDQEARACIGVAEGFDRARQQSEAVWYYERARDLDPKANQWVARRLAPLYDNLRQDERAGAEYVKAYRLDPNDPILLNEIGLFDYANGRTKEAVAMFRRAVAIDPALAIAWSNLGVALASQGRYRDAYEALCQVVSPSEARANVALAMARNADDEGADAQFEEAVALQPDLKRFQPVLDTIRVERDQKPPR